MLSLAQKLTIVSALVAFVEARFGQEQIPVAAVQALGNFGSPGEAATLAGQIPSSLLAAASPCDKLSLADKIAALGDDNAVLEAAKGLVSAETNFNPFAVDKPFVCADASLPATAALRGIIPLVDPAVTGSDTENAASATSLNTPFNADGLSQAEVMIAQGFSNFQAVDGSGARVTLAGQGGAAAGGNAGNGNANAGNDNANAGNGNANAGNGNANAGNGNANAGTGCNGGNANTGNDNGNAGATATAVSSATPSATAGAGNGNGNAGNNNGNNGNGNGNGNNNNNNNNGGGNAGANTGAADFGECTPTMDFQGGRNGRPATEFTFLPTDPLVAQGQQEALNPNIITNRICDQLTNVCNANDAAKALCQTTKAQIQALGTRDQSTADTWNAALGF